MATVIDYASLSQAVQDWFSRSDLGGFVDYFIQAAEFRIYTDIFTNNQGKGTREIESALSGTIDSNGNLALPTGYLGLKYATITVGSNTYQLQRRNAEFIFSQYPNRSATSPPTYIARDGSAGFIFGPAPDSQYAVSGVYWQRSAALSGSNTTTWMTTSIPTVLLAACNSAAAEFLKNSDDQSMWDQTYSSQLLAYLAADKAENLSGSALAMVPA